MDRLAGAALAVSKAELGERIQQQSNFEMQADELKASVARVRTHASKAVENSRHTSKVRHVRVTGDFIDRLTPQVIAAARALAGEKNLHESSRNAVVVSFAWRSHLRRDGNFPLKRFNKISKFHHVNVLLERFYLHGGTFRHLLCINSNLHLFITALWSGERGSMGK